MVLPPILAFPLALWTGVIRGVTVIIAAALLYFVALYIFFGISALWEGESPRAMFGFLKSLHIPTIMMGNIIVVLPWAMASAACAGGLRVLSRKVRIWRTA